MEYFDEYFVDDPDEEEEEEEDLYDYLNNEKKNRCITFTDKELIRLIARQKQILIGSLFPGFKNFIAFYDNLPEYQQYAPEYTINYPIPPNIYMDCSKRSFDGQINKWHRLFHDYDSIWDPKMVSVVIISGTDYTKYNNGSDEEKNKK